MRSLLQKPAKDARQPDLQVYVDGCCDPNPGAGGWAFVVLDKGEEVACGGGGEQETTNNAMELTALLRGIEWILIHSPKSTVTVWSDSAYVVNGCNSWRHGWKRSGWKRKGDGAKPHNRQIANLGIWQQIDAILSKTDLISVEWCKGHCGIPGNERADELADMARPNNVDHRLDLGALDREYAAIMEGQP